MAISYQRDKKPVFRPQLAANDVTWGYLEELFDRGETFYASTKLDGIRAIVLNGQLVSRTLKPIRNQYIQKIFGRPEFEGLDGELIVGAPKGEGVFARTSSGVMSEAGDPSFTFHVFDLHNLENVPYIERLSSLYRLVDSIIKAKEYIQVVPQMKMEGDNGLRLLEEFESQCVEEGYEGAILRWWVAPYKFGRSTLRERYMMKLKRFEDSEARIIGFEEMLHNDNEAQTDGRGYTTRSSHRDNKRPSGMLGKLVTQDIKNSQWQPKIGSGFDHALRDQIWNNQAAYLGRIVKYSFLPIGIKDQPRHPVFKGFRDPTDLDL